MLEIRFHGRGGQGTVVATTLLAKAFFQAGYQVQSFPFFGVERRGAPVEAYVRVDKEKIFLRTNVRFSGPHRRPDRTLLHSIDAMSMSESTRLNPTIKTKVAAAWSRMLSIRNAIVLRQKPPYWENVIRVGPFRIE